jgi:hypothetical protein
VRVVLLSRPTTNNCEGCARCRRANGRFHDVLTCVTIRPHLPDTVRMALGELVERCPLNEAASAAKPTGVENLPAITRVDAMVKARSSANDQSASGQRFFGAHGIMLQQLSYEEFS